MKKVFKAIALSLSAICLFSAAGCKKPVDNSENTIEIFALDAGYGLDWLYAMEEVFEEKTGYNIEISIQGDTAIEPKIKSGPDVNTTDLFITGEVWNRYISLGDKAVAGYDYILEPLDDVYEYVPEGETLSIGEKMWGSFSSFFEMEVEENGEYVNHYYAMPWSAGMGGIFYNQDLFTQANLSGEPLTTDQLMEYCQTLKDKKITPYIYSAADDYFSYCQYTWWPQYETIKGTENFWNGKVSDAAIPSAETSVHIFDQEGIREMFKVFEDMLNPAKGYVYGTVEELDYTTAQARFFAGEAAMLPCGDWLENEMNNASSSLDIGNIVPMRTPVISALSDKMSYWEEEGNFTEATRDASFAAKRKEYDEKLRDLVEYADKIIAEETAELPSFANEADAQIVIAARRVCYAPSQTHSMAIPVYATAKEAAKEFLKFTASDEGIAIYLANTSGSYLPYLYDLESYAGYDDLSEFSKKKWDILSTSEFVPYISKWPSHYLGGLTIGRGVERVSVAFGSRDAAVRTTADAAVQANKAYYTVDRMETLLRNAGLI